jgi:mannose-6-phosphate isomerase
VCEVQEYSDLTYRVYDYGRVDSIGRPRELHVDKALEVIDFQSGPVEKVQPKSILKRERLSWERLVSCRYFDTMKFFTDGPFHIKTIRKGARQFQLWAFMEGDGLVDWASQPHDFVRVNSGRFSYRQGECWFMPAVFGGYTVWAESPTRVLMATARNPKMSSDESGDAG